jgi:sterol desaturase/sphingolipid hydroxylase (fatty acid hydroxylase superfamily)
MQLLDKYISASKGYLEYLWRNISLDETHFIWGNYFYYLTLVSIVFFIAELIIPWRKNQKVFRQDFWKDAFFMYFNFFIFYIIFLAGGSEVGVHLFEKLFAFLGIEVGPLLYLNSLPNWIQFIFLFTITDFIHWSIHVLLHRIPFLWEFHKVHHSVKEMGFAAHLRYHWMESIIYKSITFIILSFFGFTIADLFIMHAIKIAWGHFNHANLNVNLGWFGYIFNNPKMHLWHHVKVLPKNHPNGINYGITLSIWDYLFKTAYQPKDIPTLEIGYENEENDNHSLSSQLSPLKYPKKNNG